MRKKAGKALLLLLAAALAFTAFNGIFFQKRLNQRPLPPHYKKGVFHLHSRFSDGRGSVEEICREARAQNLDFVILTDHGRPNPGSSAATAWNQDILLVGASEFSLQAGHMAAAGYRLPGYIFPPEAQEAIDEVERDGGVTFLSHPLDRKIPWTDWQVRGFTGIEILSLYQAAKRNILYGLTLFPLQYVLSPDYALTALLSYPQRELAIWDRCNRRGRHFGIYALDSHAKIPLGDKASLHFPSYGATFRILNVYARVERDLDRDAEAAAGEIVAALRAGRFFSAIESLAAANGFDFYYLEADGRRVEMGGDAGSAGGALVLELPFEFKTDITVRRDGAVFRQLRGNDRRRIEIPVNGPGVFRCEVFLHSGRFRKLPWILANPIFIARPLRPATPPPAPEPHTMLNPAAEPGYFQVEKNSRSRGQATVTSGPDGRATTRLAFTLVKEGPQVVDYWVCLARRAAMDFSPYHGFVFAARGSRPMRFWLQIRTHGEESWFQHSFRVDQEWRTIAIPFARFLRRVGPDAPLDLARFSAFFMQIDNGNSFAGAAGELELGPIGLY